MTDLNEEWRPVPGYPGYEVSDIARVRRLERLVPYMRLGREVVKVLPERFLQPTYSDGCPIVCLLGEDGIRFRTSPNRLAWRAFRGEVPPSWDVSSLSNGGETRLADLFLIRHADLLARANDHKLDRRGGHVTNQHLCKVRTAQLKEEVL